MTAPQAAGQRYIGSGAFFGLSPKRSFRTFVISVMEMNGPDPNCPTGSSGS